MILIGLGSNHSGAWGPPEATLQRALEELRAPGPGGLRFLAISSIYETAGVGPGKLDPFLNAALSAECHCSPDALLSRLKMIERRAGRRSGRSWAPRALDLDILDYRGLVRGWPRSYLGAGRLARRRLVLPHPLLHRRPFVLAPLLEIAPHWRHPVIGRTVRQMWNMVRFQSEGRILRRH